MNLNFTFDAINCKLNTSCAKKGQWLGIAMGSHKRVCLIGKGTFICKGLSWDCKLCSKESFLRFLKGYV